MKYIEDQQDQSCVEVPSDLGISDCIGVQEVSVSSLNRGTILCS